MRIRNIIVLLIVISNSCDRRSPSTSHVGSGSVNFEEELPELLDTVQLSGIFSDSKTFIDFPLRMSPDSIMMAFCLQKNDRNFDLRSFIATCFDTSFSQSPHYSTPTGQSIIGHIDTLWYILTRKPDPQRRSSLIALKHPYIVPGGRFREIYYWDSYFTMLGLAVSDEKYMIKNMVDNFTDLIDTYGHIPNGNRTYYLSRSQPPFFASMVALLAAVNDSVKISDYLIPMEKEYQFWMSGREQLSAEIPAISRIVRLDDSTALNRYWDNLCRPRPESYKEDVALWYSSERDSSIFRDIRAAAESGWDFSSRWFETQYSLATINTTEIIPVDLNCLLYNLEKTIAQAYLKNNDSTGAEKYRILAEKRKRAINRLLWNPSACFYYDYNYIDKNQTEVRSLAGVYPLFYKIADSIQTLCVERQINDDFLFDYGVVTTLTQPATGEQWDYPNGWPPLQWITYAGLVNYGYYDVAADLAARWMHINELIYYDQGNPAQKGKMLEKYNVVKGVEGKGGEYPLQDGFGWTNGVYMKLYSIGSH